MISVPSCGVPFWPTVLVTAAVTGLFTFVGLKVRALLTRTPPTP